MEKNKTENDNKLELTVRIDQTILADWNEFMEEWNEACEKSGYPCSNHPHTTDDSVEDFMRRALTNWQIEKAQKRYRV